MKHTFKSLLIASTLTAPPVFATSDTRLEDESAASPQTTVATVVIQQSNLKQLLFLTNLPTEVNQLIFGHALKTFNIGWVTSLKDLAALASTSNNFNKLIQPVLDATMKWRTFFVPRILLQITDPMDQEMLVLSGISNALSFDNLINLALDPRFPMIKVTEEMHAALTNRINGDARFTPLQKQILIRTLPNADPLNIRNAADSLRDLGKQCLKGSPEQQQFYDKAVVTYERSAHHPNATPKDIRNAAECLEVFGNLYPKDSAERKQFYDKAVGLFDLSVNHKSVTLDDIKWSAYTLLNLGITYYHKPAALFERIAQHPDATPVDILNAANALFVDFGNEYPEDNAERTQYYLRSAELFKLYINHPDITSEERQAAAMEYSL